MEDGTALRILHGPPGEDTAQNLKYSFKTDSKTNKKVLVLGSKQLSKKDFFPETVQYRTGGGGIYLHSVPENPAESDMRSERVHKAPNLWSPRHREKSRENSFRRRQLSPRGASYLNKSYPLFQAPLSRRAVPDRPQRPSQAALGLKKGLQRGGEWPPEQYYGRQSQPGRMSYRESRRQPRVSTPRRRSGSRNLPSERKNWLNPYVGYDMKDYY